MFPLVSITSVSLVAVTQFDVVGSSRMVLHYALYVHIHKPPLLVFSQMMFVYVSVKPRDRTPVMENNKDK